MEGHMVNGSVNGRGPHPQKLVNYQALLRLFECAGCKEFIIPPINHCRKGHLVCSTCRTNMKSNSCPMCKQRLLDTPNLAMEQVAQTVAFPCKFQQQGCSECLFLESKASHEAFCSYRPVPCQYSGNGCKEVLLFQAMVEHVKSCKYKIDRQLSMVSQTTLVATHTEVRRTSSFAKFKSSISIRSKEH